jgi:adenosylcobinamide kinase/adenosylcobinamide-phosphate guanylyltransferase
VFTFVSGGLSSGKSVYARRRASEKGPPPWLYVAPGVEGDAGLKDRIAESRRDQEAIWLVKDAPASLVDVVAPENLAGLGAVVIDRFSVWIAGQLATRPASQDHELLREVESLADGLYRSPVPLVLVTTEVGLGFLPAAVAERRLIDVVGLANQTLAERADGVVFMVSGVPLRLR